MERRKALHLQFLRQRLSHRGVGRRQFCQTRLQRAEVQHGATRKQGDSSRRADRCHFPQGVLAEAGGRIGLGRITDVDEPVWGLPQ